MTGTPHIRIGDVSALPGYVDWPALVADIKTALGIHHNSEIAKLINAPPTTVGAWINGGVEPLYGYGEAMLELHRRSCGDDATKKRLAEFRERATKAAS